ncbi:hypothetical protein Cni_G11397 [Canna indica]|uniref:Uncharacterized protein n=1 Tax=Canna indica TaxID=4628 RepID=A0AAQ3K8N9_9LILI|nr:hypothetical protein Cni_G11397 [Canna indica]
MEHVVNRRGSSSVQLASFHNKEIRLQGAPTGGIAALPHPPHPEAIHALIIVNDFLSNTSALRELLFSSAVSVPGAAAYALRLFDQIPHPDLFRWNTVIRGTSHTSIPSDAISLFTRVERAVTRPINSPSPSFSALVRSSPMLHWVPNSTPRSQSLGTKLSNAACTKLSNAALGTLINMHANCGDLASAAALFDGPARQDVVA